MSIHPEICDAVKCATENANTDSLLPRLLAFTQHKHERPGRHPSPDTAHRLVVQAIDEGLQGLHDRLWGPGVTPFRFFGAVILRIMAREKLKGRSRLNLNFSGSSGRTANLPGRRRG